MTNAEHIASTSPDSGAAVDIVDFALFPEGDLILFVPVSEQAEDHALEAFSAAMQWGPSYVVEHRYAGDIVADLFARGFHLTLDGRPIVPAWRSC